MCVFDHVKECTPEALANVTDGTMLKVTIIHFSTMLTTCFDGHLKMLVCLGGGGGGITPKGHMIRP